MLNFMLQILGTIFLVIVPSAFFIWRHLASQIASKVLSFNVTRKSPRERTTAELQGFIREVPFLKYMEVDQDYARSRYPDTPMMSLGEYMGSLHAQGEVSMQRALVSIMDRFGLRVALPLALFAPPSWRRDGLDSLAGVSKRFPLASVVLANGISSLGLFAVSAISQRSNVDMLSVRHGETSDFGSFPTNEAVEDEKGETSGEQKHKKQYAITIMARGSRDDEMCDAIPNPFSLGFDFRDFSVTRKASIEAPKQRDIRKLATAVPIHPLFPDLCFGNGGLPSLCSDAQATKNTAIAVVCNRLMTNSLIGRFESPEIPSEPFAARLTAWSDDRSQLRTHDSARMGGEAGSNVAGGSMQTPRENGEVTSLEDFVEALEKHGHTVRMHIASCTTSFGIGLSVRQEESNGGGDHCSYTQIPLAYPIETGLFAKDERGKDAKTTTLMAHASIYLDIDGPFVTAQLEWCLSIAGFTGWLPRNTVARPWQLTPGSLNFHSEDAFKTIQDRRKALRLITASSVASNAAASKGKLLFGGYGFLGVCCDSAAVIQKALTGTCTLYPLLLGGDAKLGLVNVYDSIQRETSLGNRIVRSTSDKMGSRWEYDEEAWSLRKAIVDLACDAVVDPLRAADTARRAIASLPKPRQSVFAAAEECRKGLESAAELADRLFAHATT